MEPAQKKFSAKTFFNIFAVLLSAGLLLYFCFSKDGLLTLGQHIGQIHVGWLILGFLCMLSDLFLDMVLTYFFTKPISASYTMGRAFKVCMVGHLYSAITPFQSGGQPMQIYVMSKQEIDPGAATSALVQKFFVYQTGITLYSLAAILYQTHFAHTPLNAGMWGLAIAGFIVQGSVAALLLLVSFNQKVTSKLLSGATKLLARIHVVKDYEKTVESWRVQLDFFHQSNQFLYKHKGLLIKAYALTFLQLTSLFAVSFCVYRAFHFTGATAASMIFSQAFVTMVSSLVPLPGAAGASEASFYVFFSSYFSPATLKSAILLWRIITYYAVILICAPFSRMKDKM